MSNNNNKNTSFDKTYTFGRTLPALVQLVGIVGYIGNIIQLVQATQDPITGPFLFKCFGVIFPPLGAILGFVGFF